VDDDSTLTTGVRDSAIVGDGAGPVQADVGPAAEFNTLGMLTFAAWVRMAGDGVFFEISTSEGAPRLEFYRAGAEVGARFIVLTGGPPALETVVINTTTVGAALDGQFHHIAWNAPQGDWRIFVDGAEMSLTSYPNGPAGSIDDTSTLKIPGGFVGAIDELRLYDVPLEAAGVLDDMNTVY
jgi:hypothetical protein